MSAYFASGDALMDITLKQFQKSSPTADLLNVIALGKWDIIGRLSSNLEVMST